MNTTQIENFWKSRTTSKKRKLTTLQTYEKNNAPECIRKFLMLGGGNGLGTALEEFARFKFTSLDKRAKGKGQSGHDHMVKLNKGNILVEHKTSSRCWKNNTDYKWQHVEENHKWDMLLLTGIDFDNVKFWGMDRKTFCRLSSEGKITNQGNKTGESSEGKWFYYSDVKDSLVEIQTDDELVRFASSLEEEAVD